MINLPRGIWPITFHTTCWFAVFVLAPASAQDHNPNENPVRASIADDTVWVGEPTTLEIKLYSPGPFSGVPSFDFPEVSKTYILKTARPTVSNEKVGEDEWFTQRYQFKVIVGQAGETIIPAFKVLFEGKRSFVADSEPMSGSTPQLRLTCKNPSGIKDNVSFFGASEFTVEQSWLPKTDGPLLLKAGEIFQRTVTRRAVGSTAMSFPELPQLEIDGVRIYRAAPIIEDKFDQGKLSSLRIDEVKYQFEKGGSYELPTNEFFWWDYVNEKLVRNATEGAKVEVSSLPSQVSASEPNESAANPSTIAYWILMTAIAVLFTIYFGSRMLARWKNYWQLPNIITASELIHHCRDNNARGAYRAALSWVRMSEIPRNQLESMPAAIPFFEEMKTLATICYGDSQAIGTWNGSTMATAFRQLETETKRLNLTSGTNGPLPPLNPTSQFIRN